MRNRQHAVEQHIPALRRYAYVLTGNAAEVDDMVQECLTRALAKVSLWREIRNVRAFLFTIMHNMHVDGLRRKANGYSAVSIENVAEQEMLCQPRQQAVVELSELALALKRLPASQREAISLVCLEGLTYREVAQVTGVPVGTVMSRLSRGRETLRRVTGTPSAHSKTGHTAEATSEKAAAHETDAGRPNKRIGKRYV